jgi:hypothetical protein
VFDAIVAPKTFLEVDADHNDRVLLDGQDMIDAVVLFIATSTPTGQ